MQTDDPKDPLDGKGEEMIPDRGNPFDDIEGSAPRDSTSPDNGENDFVDNAANGGKNLSEDPNSSGDPLLNDHASPDEIETTPKESDETVGTEAHDPDIPDSSDPDAALTLFDSVTEESATPTGELQNDITGDLPGEHLDEASIEDGHISGTPPSGEMSEAEIEALFGEAEALLSSEADTESPILADESLFVHKPDHGQPPEDYPDDGMGTATEEAMLAEEIPPELEDGGMSAGYPPMRDEDLPPEPEVTIARPEPAAMSGAPLFSPESFVTPGLLSGVAGGVALTQDGKQAAKPEMLKLLITDDDIKELWTRADNAQRGVIEHIATIPLGQKMLNYIQNGKNELLGGKENYEEAERFITEVEYRVSLSVKLKSLSKGLTTGLYLYQVGWAIALLLFLIVGIGVSSAFASAKMEGTPDQTYLLSSMVWGGFGGVIGALLALIKHIAIEQDFDKQHTWWYFSSPAMGIGMGAVIYLFLHVGLFSIVGADADIASPLVIYVFAWLAGYQQNIFTDLVKRMMKTLMGEDIKAAEDTETKPSFEVPPEDQT